MSDEPAVAAAASEEVKEVQEEAPRDRADKELPEPVESEERLVRPSGGGRVRTESEGYGITEEQEKKLLAEDDEDLDVIECFVDDYVSDLEYGSKRVAEQGKEEEEIGKENMVEVLQVVRIVHSPEESGENNEEEHEDPVVGLEGKAPAAEEEIDEDIIQIVEEDVEDLLGETVLAPSEKGKVEEPPEASVHVSGKTENERILSKPLVKQQVVMELSQESTGKADEKSNDGESLKVDELPATPIGTQEDSDAEQPLVIADSIEVNVGTMSACHHEDPDVLQLKLDLCQNMGEMDYEPNDPEDHPDPHKVRRTDDCTEEKLERRFQIKQEPLSPVKDRPDRIPHEDIETIVLSSDDDFLPQPKLKKSRKKSKKKSKQRSKSECSVIDVPVPASTPKTPNIKQSTSSKSLHSSDSISMDEELLKTGFRMELRKRKSAATLLEEHATPPPSRKRLNARKSIDSLSQSKSKNSITSADSHPTILDKPPKKSHKSSSIQQHSTANQINSLFAECENPQLVPPSILDDGLPLIDSNMDPFEKVFEAELYRKQPANNSARQTILIDVPPRSVPGKSAKIHGGEQKQKSNSSSSAVAALVQKPKLVSEIRQKIMQSLEDDLALSSSDEGETGPNKSHSSASKKSSARKRARPQQKQHINDYFCASSGGDKRDNVPVDDSQPVAEPQISGKKLPSQQQQSQAKRRRKRRISSSSSSLDGETATTAESVSLTGTSSSTMTTNTVRSMTGGGDEETTVERESAKTDAMRVVLSPLTDEKIEKLSRCNTSKKTRALSKACQTELQGLTWSIHMDQIDFRSEYFEKLYQLITNGRELMNRMEEKGARRSNDFREVVMAGRDAVLPPTPPERSPQRPVGQANGHARSEIEELLFQHADEVKYVSTTRVDPAARERMERSVRSIFRIPKLVKQPSRSPQDVTSSTQHENEQQQQQYKEDEPRRTTTGYSNDRPLEPRRQTAAGNRSPLRFDDALSFNRPEPEPRSNPVAATAEQARPLRRTIRNNNVQPAVVVPPAQPQPTPVPAPPIENGFPAYGVSEQPPQQYRPSGGNMFQQQQPQQQLGAYLPSGQDLDVKPNLSALASQTGLLPTRFLDSFSIICQLTMMQMMQQQQHQLQFPGMNPQGVAIPPVVGSNLAMPPQMMPQNGQFPLQSEASTSGGPRFGGAPLAATVPSDEISDQISQIFGCIDHLKGRCIKNPCQYSHTLPTESNLRQMLLSSPQDVVMTTYQFIVGQDNLFMRYFPVYAEVMGRRNMRHQLLDAVPHCEQSKRAFSYYRCIVEGLTLNGTLNRAKAVQLVLEKHRKINFDQINVLITLILDTNEDIPQFFQWLDQFSHVQDYHYEVASINRLLKFTARSIRPPPTDIIKLTYRLILSVPTGTETFVDTNVLLEFVELLIKSNLGLDPEKIRHKYRENEMQSATRR